MEPFGLFHLLNTLLSPPQKSPAENTENFSANGNNFTPQTANENLQTPASPLQTDADYAQAPPAQNPSGATKPNACAAFFEAHEGRAHRRK